MVMAGLIIHCILYREVVSYKAFSQCGWNLPTLEIEELDRKDEDTSKKQHPQEENRTNGSKEVVLESIVAAKILLHSRRVRGSNDRQWSVQIAKLRSHKPVYSPGQGAEPVVPDPPRRNVLKWAKNEV